MMPFVRELGVRPYRSWLIIVLAAMLVETLMSLAAPWPLKLVLDDALGAPPAAGSGSSGRTTTGHRPRHAWASRCSPGSRRS